MGRGAKSLLAVFVIVTDLLIDKGDIMKIIRHEEYAT